MIRKTLTILSLLGLLLSVGCNESALVCSDAFSSAVGECSEDEFDGLEDLCPMVPDMPECVELFECYADNVDCNNWSAPFGPCIQAVPQSEQCVLGLFFN